MRKRSDPLASFHEPVRAWFKDSFPGPTPAQIASFPAIAAGESTLVLAPTGSGKTLAAFLVALDRLLFSSEPAKAERCKVLYVSPLKALAVDVERNLRAPLAGITAYAGRTSVKVRPVTVEVRTGDTPQGERARMARTPPDVLVTTPESLYLLLTSRARSILASIDTVIVDEIHSLVPTKRGAHLFLSLERLERLRGSGRPGLQRIGLSATQRPLDEVARLLGGARGGVPRPVTLVDAGVKRAVELTVEVPVDDMAKLGEREELPRGNAAGTPARKSIWPSIHERLVELVAAHRSTMIFVNSRRSAERLSGALNELAGQEISACHHGSIAREQRAEIEDRLKRGILPAIVATSSLELGVDMGAVDLVVQIEAPPSVASGLQRVGRAGHATHLVSRGIVFPKHRGDLVACAAAASLMRAADVEETFYPRNPLDVLAQQIVAVVSTEEQELPVDALYDLVRQAAPFAELPRSSFEGVLDMLSGRYPSDDFSELRPRLTWDRVGGTLKARSGALRLAIVNGGTIPDRGLYGVFLATGEGGKSRRVGELDEEMVFESRPGEVFLLGTSSWRIEEITHDRVLVTPAPGEPGKMPFWHGDRAGRAPGFGRAVGALCRELGKLEEREAVKRLRDEHGLDVRAARNLFAFLAEQSEATGELPTDRTVVVERYTDEMGDLRVCVMSPWGARVHAPWATAVRARLEAGRGLSADVMWTDDGMVFRFPESDRPPETDWFFPSPDEVRAEVVRTLSSTSLFASRFRECAGRALLLPRRQPGKRTALWAQRRRAADLLAVASRFPSFPIVLETFRDCLQDVFDLPGLMTLLQGIAEHKVRVVTVDTKRPSPFASSLMFSYVAEFLYEGDAPLAERRAQALRIDQSQLRELLGDAELRELLDPESIDLTERILQRMGEKSRARDADGVHDLLLGLGDLSLAELGERTAHPEALPGFLEELTRARRVIELRMGRGKKYVAAEDMARYRDALGIVPPGGLPSAFLVPSEDPLGELLSRYARTHTPFEASALAQRWGLGIAGVREVLDRLVGTGRLVEGEFLPTGRGREYCDPGVLKTLRQKSLARLRKEIEPVAPSAFGAFLPSWQGVTRPSRGSRPAALLRVIEQLEGAPIPASALETDVLPSRCEGYSPSDLDALFMTGEVVWGGIEPLGPSDGRVALYRTDHEPLLARASSPVEGELASRVRGLLERRGALFFAEIARSVGDFSPDVGKVLWDMVWAGELTNDTLSPLRSLLRAPTDVRRTSRGHGPPAGTEGRWSLRSARREKQPSEGERSLALARSLLQRHGVVTREAVHAEGIPGGFSAVYEVLKGLEDRGQVRRGYFIAGCGATQFAQPGADDALRADNDPGEPLVLATTDPANPYGAALPWPEPPGARPQRAARTYVVLLEGALVGYLGRGEQSLLTFLPEGEPERSASARALARALARLVEGGRRKTLLIATVDGAPPSESKLAGALVEAGFTLGIRGALKRKPDALPPLRKAPVSFADRAARLLRQGS